MANSLTISETAITAVVLGLINDQLRTGAKIEMQQKLIDLGFEELDNIWLANQLNDHYHCRIREEDIGTLTISQIVELVLKRAR